MKRDMDLIRSILLTIENDLEMTGNCYRAYTIEHFPGHSLDEIDYHVDMLFEAGLVTGAPSSNHPLINKLTWQGEFIAVTKNPGLWEKVKERVKKVGLHEVALPLLLELAKDEAKKLLMSSS
jgi:hypothetical protein